MARTRYIKPDFFTDEDVAELPTEARLIFIGLWCHADRKGRLEDRPKFFKVALAPYDNIDIEAIIGVLALAEKPFIKHYEVEGKRYIQIINFEKHQRPHHTERDSICPDPKKGITVKERLDNGYLTVRQRSAPLYSSNGDGNGDGERNGEGDAVLLQRHGYPIDTEKDNPDAAAPLPLSGKDRPEPTASHPSPASPGQPETEIEKSYKTDTIKKGGLPAGQYPEADILAVAAQYCELKSMQFVSDDARRVYLRGRGMFYPAKDLLSLNGGDVERARLCLVNMAAVYESQEKDWNWKFLLEDFPKWDEERREYELQQAELAQSASEPEPA